MEIIVDSKNNGKLIIKEIDKNTAKNIIINNHYSRTWNTSFGIINVGIFKYDNPTKCLGCAVFGNLMQQSTYSNIADVDKGEIIELNRMWIDDCLGKNAESILISRSFKIIKATMPKVKLIQSFADGRLGCGTIYKASNFRYYGTKKAIFGKSNINGDVVMRVNFENTRRYNYMSELCYRFSKGEFNFFEVTTYRYIYALHPKYYKLIKLKELEYPKYEKGMRDSKFTLPISNLIRGYVILDKMGKTKEAEELRQYCTERCTDEEFKLYVNKAEENKFIKGIKIN